MEPEIIMNDISKEILITLKAMKKAKTAEDKLTHSQTVKNLCESLGVFLSAMSDMGLYSEEDDYDDDDGIPF